jgi:uncharacterized protein YxjI
MKVFKIHQKITPLVNQYRVYEEIEGNQQKPVAFVQQKRFAFREKFTVYEDESKGRILVDIQARQTLDLGARYDITTPDGDVLGVVGKAFKASLLKSTWHIYKPGQEEKPYLRITERSLGLAVFRRVWGFIPYIGDLPFFLKYHFDFSRPGTGAVQAAYEKTTLLKDHYRLQIEDGTLQDLDWRVFVAIGIMLDALQSR